MMRIENGCGTKVDVGIIGGTGVGTRLLALPGRAIAVPTEFGIARGKIVEHKGARVIVLSRHSAGHKTPPHLVNYKALASAMKALQVKACFSTAAVGSLRADWTPGTVLVASNVLDLTFRNVTLFDRKVIHTPITRPFTESLRQLLLSEGGSLGETILNEGVYVGLNGPRYETASEIQMLRSLGGDVVGMTASTEAVCMVEAGVPYANLCIVTNLGAGLVASDPFHQEVEDMMNEKGEKVGRIASKRFGQNSYAMNLPLRSFAFCLALTRGVGGKTVARVIAQNALLGRTPEEFFKLSMEAYQEEYRLSSRIAESVVKTRTELSQLLELQERLIAQGVHLAIATDAHFPHQVEEFDPNPPAALFLYGNAALLKRDTFCVLSSRNAREGDLELLESITEDSVLDGQVLVSGHDRVEYQRSAVVPLRWGAPRILCLDRGMYEVLGPDLKSEAFRAARLWRYEFDPRTDLVISPFRPNAGFSGINNQIRDRLVASFANRIDFVRIEPGGNMEKLLQLGLKAGRAVRVSDRIHEYRRYRELGAEVIAT